MPREYFCAYHSYLRGIRRLSDAERGRLFTALLQYSAGEEELIKLQGREEVLFDVYADQIDRDNERYEEKCRKNQENILRRYTTEHDRIRSNTTDPQDKDKGKDKDNDKGKGESIGRTAPARRPFTPPTVEEIAAYCTERGNGVNPQQFFDFYESKGWMVGKNRMKDWKAAVRTWERRDGREAGPERPETSYDLDGLEEYWSSHVPELSLHDPGDSAKQ